MPRRPPSKPPTFVFFTNVATEFHFSYERFLQNRLRESFGLTGSPVRILVRRRGKVESKTWLKGSFGILYGDSAWDPRANKTADLMDIPNRSLFKPPEVCEIAKVQPYVLRSWEAEFPDLGVAKAGSGQRMYRRTDVQRVLRIKELLFVEGLTVAGARRRLEEEGGGRSSEEETGETSLTELLGADARERIADVRQGLRWILELLAGNGGSSLKRAPALFEVGRAAAPAARSKKPAVKKKKARR